MYGNIDSEFSNAGIDKRFQISGSDTLQALATNIGVSPTEQKTKKPEQIAFSHVNSTINDNPYLKQMVFADYMISFYLATTENWTKTSNW